MVALKLSKCTLVVALTLALACSVFGFLGVEKENPYVFGDEDFSTLFKTQEGEVKVLKKFTENSQLFRGIENIRMLIFEINPLCFVIPSHWDSDLLFFITQGRGTITLVFADKFESFNLQKGHLMTVPAGTTFYMINRDDHDILILSGFVVPIANTGGQFTPFFGAGGQDPESLYSAFSPDVLETLFNSSSDSVRKLFSKQKNGVILKASKDQIKALSAEEDGNLPHGRSYCLKEYGPCQIYDHCTSTSEFGTIFMVFPTDYLEYQDLNMYTSFSVTVKGGMNSPLHSTRVTKVIMVISGSGRFEMAAPYYKDGSTGIHYKKMTAELKRGMLIVVPPGYSLILVASQDENLETLNYEFFAKKNAAFLLGGVHNVMKNFQKEAKELAFASSAEEVDEVLYKQNSLFFMRGPVKPQQQDSSVNVIGRHSIVL